MPQTKKVDQAEAARASLELAFTVLGQIGVLTLVAVFGPLVLGLWLDKTFATRQHDVDDGEVEIIFRQSAVTGFERRFRRHRITRMFEIQNHQVSNQRLVFNQENARLSHEITF